MKCRLASGRDEMGFAVRGAIPAARRKSLAIRNAAAYSSLIDTEHRLKERTEP
jgi:hypothetical protein